MLTPEQQAALQPIAEALLAIGYAPADLVWDAALRMSWAPDLMTDFFAYSERFRAAGRHPGSGPDTAGTLAGGHSVDELMRDYLLGAPGAWLMAAALLSHPAEAQAMLDRLVIEGMTVVDASGAARLMEVPAAERYPACPYCGTRLTQRLAVCPTCGWDLSRPVVDAPAPATLPDDAAGFCMRCGAEAEPTDTFCQSCGAPLA